MTAARIGLGLAALLLAADAPALPIDQVIAAERAFAEDGLAHGINVSFPRHAAPDAIIFAPGPVNVRERFAGRAPEAQNPGLDWWPVFAGAARSGDLGFTTGPYALQGTVSGYYFTVWRRQPDGSWQWIFDGGGEASVDQAPAKGSPVARLAPSAGHAASAEAAMDEVRAAEAGLARDARLHAARALAARLAPDVRLYVAGQRPVTRAADAAPALAPLHHPRIEVRVVALGTGQALDSARRGDADVVFVHDQAAEDKFVAEGFGVKRLPVMYNDFVLIGPKGDPAGVRGKDIGAALKKLASGSAAFVSRGDKSGTHAAELRYWKAADVNLDAAKPAGYKECGCGMGPALADRGTWLNFKNRGELAILVEGDQRLFNQYGVMAVNPAVWPHVKKDLAQAFVDWVVSPAGQAAIAGYRIGGEQLFFPNAR